MIRSIHSGRIALSNVSWAIPDRRARTSIFKDILHAAGCPSETFGAPLTCQATLAHSSCTEDDDVMFDSGSPASWLELCATSRRILGRTVSPTHLGCAMVDGGLGWSGAQSLVKSCTVLTACRQSSDVVCAVGYQAVGLSGSERPVRRL